MQFWKIFVHISIWGTDTGVDEQRESAGQVSEAGSALLELVFSVKENKMHFQSQYTVGQRVTRTSKNELFCNYWANKKLHAAWVASYLQMFT